MINRTALFLFGAMLMIQSCNEFRSETISIKAHGINEGCDEFNHLWEVDSVSDEEYNFLIGETLYSKLASEKLGDNRKNDDRNETLFAIGRLSKGTYLRDFTCQNTWFFKTDSCSIKKH